MYNFEFSLIGRNPTSNNFSKKAIWGLKKVVSSKVGLASGRVGSRGSSDIFVALSLYFPLLYFSLLWFLFKSSFSYTVKALAYNLSLPVPCRKRTSSP